MTDTELLIQTLRSGLGLPYRLNDTAHPNWANVYRLAAQQGVAAIVWDGIEQYIRKGEIGAEQMPDRATKLQWALSVEQTESRYAKQCRAITKLTDIYSAHGIKMLILKGYGLSTLYPTPSHRRCSDIDIWLFGQQQRADDILRNMGVAIDEDKHHHTVFTFEGVMVENHYDFLNTQSHRSNRDLEAHLKQLAEQPEPMEIEGRTIYRPNANCHALFLLRHAAAHFAAVEIVLRHIIDWALFVKHNHNAIDWTWLREVCRAHNMELFLDAINGLAIDLCDIEPASLPATTRRTALEERILNDILTPEFNIAQPKSGVMRIIWYKLRRWWANRWKHRIVYRDGLAHTFLTQMRSHLAKPKSIQQL